VVQLINQGANSPPSKRPDAPAATYLPQQKGSGTWEDGKVLEDCPESLPGEQSDAAVAFGQMKVTNGETSYVGSIHWEAILNGVRIMYSLVISTQPKN
jgi:hypothetical protein